ncbi:hypothetical protein F1643_20935 [Azospirillum sp. INR13]|uniref:hypothetical protein n=1 Tax=Azospirillum sp. INR13 TaxID=2596919 RepID=UPI0018920968|nr:hypothetical protein [Azospirillum sp. INR13]MBF5096465.1 hypothetical protein [Azospirillum sp. INR13]
MSYRNNHRNRLALSVIAIGMCALVVSSQLLPWLHTATLIASAVIAAVLLAWLGFRYTAFWRDIWMMRRAFNQAVDEANERRSMEPLSRSDTKGID